MDKPLTPVTKIGLLVIATLYVYLPLSPLFKMIWMGIALIPLLCSQHYKWGCVFLAIYIVQVAVSYHLLPFITNRFLLFIVSYLSIGLRVLMPGLSLAVYAFLTTPVHQWLAAFQYLKMPNWLFIPLAVMVRFFPTIKQDYISIRQALAIRGIGTSTWQLLKHPLQSLEYLIVPLLLDAVKVSEDLTVSALTKGIGMPIKRTSFYQISFQTQDIVYVGVTLLPALLWLLGRVV